MLATMLMRDGHWRGPSVLIAPAYRKLLEMTRQPIQEDLGLPEKQRKNVVVMQSATDRVVDMEDTRRLCQKNQFELQVIPGVGDNAKHSLWDIVRGFGALQHMIAKIHQR